jgi:hypothetical protein
VTPLTSHAAKPPAVPLVTTGAHCHPVAADCPPLCLTGLLSGHALNRLLPEIGGPGRDGTVGDIAELHRARQLGRVRGLGAGRIAEIEEVLLAAGVIDPADCCIANAAAPAARGQRIWITVVDGPVIRYLRESSGFPQSLLARLCGLAVSTIARLENQPASFCHRTTLNRLAEILGVPPAGLEHPGYQKSR